MRVSQGDLDAERDAATPPRTLLFLCSGNYYRSRFAELVVNERARIADIRWRAISAGLLPQDLLAELGAMSPTVLERARGLGIAVDATRSPRPVTLADFESADRVIALKEAEHRPMIRTRFPDWEHRVVYWTVHDVDVMPPHEALPILETAVIELVAGLRGA